MRVQSQTRSHRLEWQNTITRVCQQQKENTASIHNHVVLSERPMSKSRDIYMTFRKQAGDCWKIL